MVNDVECIFMCLFTIYISFFVINDCFSLLPSFEFSCFILLLKFEKSLYVIDTKPLLDKWFTKISPSL